MDFFSHEGDWWLPDAPRRKIPGALTFDSAGIKLVLRGRLRKPQDAEPGAVIEVGPPDWEDTPIVHGRTSDRKRVTLIGVGGANSDVVLGGDEDVREHYIIDFALVGNHTDADSFTEAWIQFDVLDAWADPPSIADEDSSGYRFKFGDREMLRTEVDRTTIRLVSSSLGTFGDSRVNLHRATSFHLSLAEPAGSREILKRFARPLSDLLTVALGRSASLTDLQLRPTDADKRSGTATTFFAAVQPKPQDEVTLGSILTYTAPTLLTAKNPGIPLDELIPTWFKVREELDSAITAFTAPFNAPFMFSEHRFSSVFQSAEALATEPRVNARDVDEDAHNARVEAIVSAARNATVLEEDVEWAERVLTARNDKPLWRRIDALVAGTGEIGIKLREAAPHFGRVAASSRTSVSHPGTKKRKKGKPTRKKLDPVGRYWYGQGLEWIVRSHLLLELGFDPTEVERRVLDRSGFLHALDEIRDNPPKR